MLSPSSDSTPDHDEQTPPAHDPWAETPSGGDFRTSSFSSSTDPAVVKLDDPFNEPWNFGESSTGVVDINEDPWNTLPSEKSDPWNSTNDITWNNVDETFDNDKSNGTIWKTSQRTVVDHHVPISLENGTKTAEKREGPSTTAPKPRKALKKSAHLQSPTDDLWFTSEPLRASPIVFESKRAYSPFGGDDFVDTWSEHRKVEVEEFKFESETDELTFKTISVRADEDVLWCHSEERNVQTFPNDPQSGNQDLLERRLADLARARPKRRNIKPTFSSSVESIPELEEKSPENTIERPKSLDLNKVFSANRCDSLTSSNPKFEVTDYSSVESPVLSPSSEALPILSPPDLNSPFWELPFDFARANGDCPQAEDSESLPPPPESSSDSLPAPPEELVNLRENSIENFEFPDTLPESITEDFAPFPSDFGEQDLDQDKQDSQDNFFSSNPFRDDPQDPFGSRNGDVFNPFADFEDVNSALTNQEPVSEDVNSALTNQEPVSVDLFRQVSQDSLVDEVFSPNPPNPFESNPFWTESAQSNPFLGFEDAEESDCERVEANGALGEVESALLKETVQSPEVDNETENPDPASCVDTESVLNVENAEVENETEEPHPTVETVQVDSVQESGLNASDVVSLPVSPVGSDHEPVSLGVQSEVRVENFTPERQEAVPAEPATVTPPADFARTNLGKSYSASDLLDLKAEDPDYQEFSTLLAYKRAQDTAAGTWRPIDFLTGEAPPEKPERKTVHFEDQKVATDHETKHLPVNQEDPKAAKNSKKPKKFGFFHSKNKDIPKDKDKPRKGFFSFLSPHKKKKEDTPVRKTVSTPDLSPTKKSKKGQNPIIFHPVFLGDEDLPKHNKYSSPSKKFKTLPILRPKPRRPTISAPILTHPIVLARRTIESESYVDDTVDDDTDDFTYVLRVRAVDSNSKGIEERVKYYSVKSTIQDVFEKERPKVQELFLDSERSPNIVTKSSKKVDGKKKILNALKKSQINRKSLAALERKFGEPETEEDRLADKEVANLTSHWDELKSRIQEIKDIQVQERNREIVPAPKISKWKTVAEHLRAGDFNDNPWDFVRRKLHDLKEVDSIQPEAEIVVTNHSADISKPNTFNTFHPRKPEKRVVKRHSFNKVPNTNPFIMATSEVVDLTIPEMESTGDDQVFQAEFVPIAETHSAAQWSSYIAEAEEGEVEEGVAETSHGIELLSFEEKNSPLHAASSRTVEVSVYNEMEVPATKPESHSAKRFSQDLDRAMQIADETEAPEFVSYQSPELKERDEVLRSGRVVCKRSDSWVSDEGLTDGQQPEASEAPELRKNSNTTYTITAITASPLNCNESGSSVSSGYVSNDQMLESPSTPQMNANLHHPFFALDKPILLGTCDVQQDPCKISPEDLDNVKRHWEERLSSEPAENLFPKHQEKPERPNTIIDLQNINDNVESESTDMTLRKQQWEQMMQEGVSPMKTPKSPYPKDENDADPRLQDISAIEVEIRMAEEREAALKRERSKNQAELTGSVEGKRPEVTYNEMTEADRGSQLNAQHNIIMQDIMELKRREEEVKRDKQRVQNGPQKRAVSPRPKSGSPRPSIGSPRPPPSENIILSEIEVVKQREVQLNKEREQARRSSQNSTPEIYVTKTSVDRVDSAPPALLPVQEPLAVRITSRKVNASPQSVTSNSPQSFTSNSPRSMTSQSPKPTSQSPRPMTSQSPKPTSQSPRPMTSSSPQPGNGRMMPDIASFEQRQGGNVIIRDMQEYQDRLRELEEQRRKLGQIPDDRAEVPFDELSIKPSNAAADNMFERDFKPFKSSTSMDFHRRLSSDSTSSRSSSSRTLSQENLNKHYRMEFAMDETERITLAPNTESIIERERRLVRDREDEYRRSKGLEIQNEPKYVDLDVKLEPNTRERKSERSGDRNYASCQLRSEIKRQRQREMDLKKEGKIRTTSEDHIDVPYAGSGGMRRQLSLEGLVDGAEIEGDTVDGVVRRNKNGSVDPERRKSHNPQQSRIEKEMSEMRRREDELKKQRQSWAGQDGVTRTTAVYKI